MQKPSAAAEALAHRIRRRVGRAIGDYQMIAPGDRVLVAVSGGKDSYTLLFTLRELQRRAPVAFSLFAVTLDPGFPDFDARQVRDFLAAQGFAHHLETTNIYATLKTHGHPEDGPCSFCARLRRGVLYRLARRFGCSRVALGHHADDLIETLVLNLVFNGQLKAMAPLLAADDGWNTVIRPLCYVWEDDTASFAKAWDLPLIPSCNACTERDLKRREIKQLLAAGEKRFPGLKKNMLSALSRLNPRHLMDKNHFPFTPASGHE